MGSLPGPRVTPSRPFQHAGVDYAGPVLVRTSKGRGHKTTKAYIAVFVCLSTKAVHIEAVSDYTAEAFLAALRRFISRRGVPQVLYSDCGTNFVGAEAELRALFAASGRVAQQVGRALAEKHIQWRFSPPAAPHFGGLWEAAVKSIKHHLRRVLGDATLTFEELATFLTEVEACLNSRPLSPLSDDPDDVAAVRSPCSYTQRNAVVQLGSDGRQNFTSLQLRAVAVKELKPQVEESFGSGGAWRLEVMQGVINFSSLLCVYSFPLLYNCNISYNKAIC